MYRCLFIVLLALSFFSCIKKENKVTHSEVEKKQLAAKNNDSVLIEIDNSYLIYSKQEFDLITDSFPQLKGIRGAVEHPDSAYLKYPVFTTGYTFGSEVGQDEFYLLYAHFLRERDGDKNNEDRDNLIKIYRKLNEVYQELNRGGTYFGHMYKRIVGYAEYEIYNLSIEDTDLNTKNFSKEKQEFIELLEKDVRKIIEEDDSSGTEINRTQVLEYVKQLNNMLTSEFYVSKAKDFKKEYYNY